MNRLVVLGLAGLGLAGGPVSARACESFSEALSLVRSDVVVGSVEARTAHCKTDVDYVVTDNGRGPRHVEHIVHGKANIPIEYSVVGTSEFGSKVDELYQRQGNAATWRSQSDAGQLADARGRLYLVKDYSPYSLAVYARALLSSSHGALPTTPDGELRITKLKEHTFAAAKRSQRVTLYRIEGRDTAPDYVALDRQLRLFAARVDQTLSIRKGWEDQAPATQAVFEALNRSRLEELQKRLARVSDRPIRIRSVRIFDSESGTLSARSDVVVKGGRIAQVVASRDDAPPPKGEMIVEGNGGVLVPGLHDMHAHYSVDVGLLYLAGGITTVRDMGNDNARLLKTVADLEAGVLPGPDVVHNGFIEGKSPYSASAGIRVDNLNAALDAVRWYKSQGYWQIKIYNSFDPSWVKPVAALAHSLHMGVAGHIPAFATPDQMIDAGYDEIAHENQLMLGWLLEPGEDTRTTLRQRAVQRAAELDLSSHKVMATVDHMRRKGTALNTTLAIREQLMLSRAGENPPTFAAVIEHFPVGLRREARQTWLPISSPEEDARYRKGFARILDMIRLLHANGIRLLPGSDDGEGFALDRELELYVAAGMTPAEVLSNATLGMARYLGRDKDHGSIAMGKSADMFLIAGDPTKDIAAVRYPTWVSKGKYHYFPDEINGVLNVQPFAARPNVWSK